MKRHGKEKGEHSDEVPEIFKDLWGFNFVEEMSFSRVKNEMWPKIRIVIVCAEDENKVKMVKTILQKYEFPFSNLKIVPGENKKELSPKEKSEPSVKSEVSGKKPNKITFKADSHRFKFPAR